MRIPLVILVLMLGPSPAASEALTGPAAVIDGDTVEVDGQRLDLYAIDAPELGQICEVNGRPFDCGEIARAALLDLKAGATLACDRVEGAPGAAVCRADDYDIGAGMVYTGWALAEPGLAQRYGKTQIGAESRKRGLWRGRFVTPWSWRDGERLPN